MVWNLSDEEDTAVNRLGMVHHGRTRKHCHLKPAGFRVGRQRTRLSAWWSKQLRRLLERAMGDKCDLSGALKRGK